MLSFSILLDFVLVLFFDEIYVFTFIFYLILFAHFLLCDQVS